MSKKRSKRTRLSFVDENKEIMDYEKKYKELEGKIKKAYLYAQTDSTKAVLEDILPELAMSEDNRIRKKLCKAIWTFIPHEEAQKYIAWLEKQESVEEIVERCKKSWYNEGKIAGMAEGLTDDEKYQQGWHDALEKQGKKEIICDKCKKEHPSHFCQDITALGRCALEHNTANNVEPKFHEGEWIISNDKKSTYQVIEVKRGIYVIRDNADNHEYHIGIEECEKSGRIWGVSDAKDGDVLYSLDSKQPFIFKHRKKHEQAEVYCGVNIYGKFFVENTKDCIITTDKYIPATKEQRDTLMKAMADAGYEFDFEKKELKKVENEIEVPFSVKDSELKEEIYYIPKGFYAEIDDDKVVIKKGKKPTAWSQEDERIALGIEQLCNCASLLNILPVKINKVRTWLKSIKERII